MRAEQEAQVIPVMARSTCWVSTALVVAVLLVDVLMAPGPAWMVWRAPGDDVVWLGSWCGSADDGVARLGDGGLCGLDVQRAVAADEDLGLAAGVEVDLHAGHAADLVELLGDAGHAVPAGHAADDELVGLGLSVHW